MRKWQLNVPFHEHLTAILKTVVQGVYNYTDETALSYKYKI